MLLKWHKNFVTKFSEAIIWFIPYEIHKRMERRRRKQKANEQTTAITESVLHIIGERQIWCELKRNVKLITETQTDFSYVKISLHWIWSKSFAFLFALGIQLLCEQSDVHYYNRTRLLCYYVELKQYFNTFLHVSIILFDGKAIDIRNL